MKALLNIENKAIAETHNLALNICSRHSHCLAVFQGLRHMGPVEILVKPFQTRVLPNSLIPAQK